MQRRKRILRIALLLLALCLCCCGLPLNWLHHQRMHEHPERIYPHYKRELQEYGRCLEAGEVLQVEGRGYAIPQFLIDKGAKRTVKIDECFVVVFYSILDNPSPQLWFCPAGFDPIPTPVEKVATNPNSRWQLLATQWASCYDP